MRNIYAVTRPKRHADVILLSLDCYRLGTTRVSGHGDILMDSLLAQLRILVGGFICGAAIMALIIAASRML